MRSDTLIKFLYVASYLFLGLPYFVFFGGWFRQPYSTIFILILVVGTLVGLRTAFDCIRNRHQTDTHLSARSMFLILLPMLVVAITVGAGGWGPQDSDWFKHNSILRDLITESWPVIYDVNGHKVMLTYYTAYQLPAAVVGKLLGWNAANHFLFAYTTIGFCLSALWVWVLTGAGRWWIILIFLAFSGMDFIGQIIFTLDYEPTLSAAVSALVEHIGSLKHIEWWSGWGFAQFSSMASLMMWVPNQGISGWLLISLVLFDGKLGSLHRTGILYLGLSTLWAPFVSLGLLPFVLAIAVYQWRESQYDSHFLRAAISLPNIAGFALGLIVVIYLAGRFQDYELPIDVGNVYQEGITFTFLRLPSRFLPKYILFIFLEFAVLHGLLYWYLMHRTKAPFDTLRRLLIVSSIILVALPILNWGWNNEPAMRTSIPAIFITALIAIYVISDSPVNLHMTWIRRALIVVLVTGSLTAVVEIGRHAAGVYNRNALIHIPDKEAEVRTIFELQEQRYKGYYNFLSQYLGSADSFFARYLSRR